MNQANDIFYLNPESELSDSSAEIVHINNQISIKEEISTQVHTSDTVVSQELEDSLAKLTKLIANTTEAYTSAIYLVDTETNSLTLGGAHTLSRDFDYHAQIGIGCGLIGWTAQSGTRVSVSPFEHDSTTLICYTSDQSLKSFIAVPIIDKSGKIRGVIACDSRKSYAFAKVTEKILMDFSEQVLILLNLHHLLRDQTSNEKPQVTEMSKLLKNLRDAKTEEELLTLVANLPTDILTRDALVVLVTAQGGVGRGVFYSAAQPQSRIEHRLLELVCRHKRIICAERSVHALSSKDTSQRSFLSVPFQVLGKEAGSLNLLSCPHHAFHASQISTLETIADAIGRELEHIRLRDMFDSSLDTNGILSWKSFSIRANVSLKEARQARMNLSLVRLKLNNLSEVEHLAGTQVAVGVMQKIMRLVEQVKRDTSIACYLYGFQILILMESAQVKRTVARLRKLIEHISVAELASHKSAPSNLKLGELLAANTDFAVSECPRDGESLSELVAKSLRYLDPKEQKQRGRLMSNVRFWG